VLHVFQVRIVSTPEISDDVSSSNYYSSPWDIRDRRRLNDAVAAAAAANARRTHSTGSINDIGVISDDEEGDDDAFSPPELPPPLVPMTTPSSSSAIVTSKEGEDYAVLDR
jgi:hypothetical protein